MLYTNGHSMIMVIGGTVASTAGFPKTHLFAQGGAENLRNSRTLSITVRPHKATGE